MTGHEKTPKEIVAELDKYVVGQAKAKKAVAIALRNRYRRMQLSEDMQEEITPKTADKRLVKLLVPAQKKQEKMSQQQAFSKMMSDLQSGNYANLFNQQEEPEDVTDEIAD